MSSPRIDTAEHATAPRVFAAHAHGKVNLHLGVGNQREDGFHDLVTVFQSLSLTDTVTLTEVAPPEAPQGFQINEPSELRRNLPASLGAEDVVTTLTVEGSVPGLKNVPRDASNLAWRAVVKVVERVRAAQCASQRSSQRSSLPATQLSSQGASRESALSTATGDQPAGSVPDLIPGRVALHIKKGIPVAGGMAGGSADAAAALLAANAWLGSALSHVELLDIAAELGSDVPFCLVGGTVMATGRGEQMIPMLSRGTYWWVLAISKQGLRTPEVFAKLDQLRAQGKLNHPSVDTGDLALALAGGNPIEVGAELVNDLQIPALSLRPDLRKTLSAGQSAGALSGIISGSGPTCAFLCRDEDHAREVADELSDAQVAMSVVIAHGPAAGAEITINADGEPD